MARPFMEEPTGSVANYPLFDRGKDSTTAYLYRLFQERIVMFDGAMGTMIQKHKLGEEEYRGELFKVGSNAEYPLPERPMPCAQVASFLVCRCQVCGAQQVVDHTGPAIGWLKISSAWCTMRTRLHMTDIVDISFMSLHELAHSLIRGRWRCEHRHR